MRKLRLVSFENSKASIGIGAMIVFIAMVLVAGIAAMVIIDTSSTLETQTLSTGRQTTYDVGNGLTVFAVEGYAESGADISKLAILIRPTAGTTSIDINHIFIELNNESRKVILNYSDSYFASPDGLSDIFNANVFPDDDFAFGSSNNRDGVRFGVLVFDDPDNSISSTNPLLNKGDKVYLCINTSGTFNGIEERKDITGMVIPEIGMPGLIDFTTPATYDNVVMELFWDM